MGTYDVARNKTKTAIIEAFWKLYAEKDISKITVRDITEATGIHRATFYLYFDNVFAVLDTIKGEQLEKLNYVCSTYTSSNDDYAEFLNAMRTLYDENETLLEPLLCRHRGNEFAIQYRQVMKTKLRQDIGWEQYPEDSREYWVVDSVLSGMIETFIMPLMHDRNFYLLPANKGLSAGTRIPIRFAKRGLRHCPGNGTGIWDFCIAAQMRDRTLHISILAQDREESNLQFSSECRILLPY